MKTIGDPTCGTGGFFLGAYTWLNRPGAGLDTRVYTEGIWFYGLRTNKHFTLKTSTLKADDLQDFIACCRPENRRKRKETERFKFYRYEDLIARDKASLDIFWLKDESLESPVDLPPPEVLQQEIIDHIERLWKQMHDHVTRNHQHPTMESLMAAVFRFLEFVQPFPGTKVSTLRMAA